MLTAVIIALHIDDLAPQLIESSSGIFLYVSLRFDIAYLSCIIAS